MTEEIAVTKYLSEPERLAEYIRQSRNLHVGFEFCKLVVELKNRIDSTLDPVIPAMEEVFEEDKPKEYSGMTFFEAMRSSTTLDSTTIERHIRVERMYDVVPENVLPAIQMMPFRSKIQIANAVEDGYDLTETGTSGKSRFEELADAYYPQDISVKLHEIKGTTPRNQFCKFEVDKEGVVWAYTAHGKFVYYEPKAYENPEIAELMDWVHRKAIRKLGATPK
jgi:hypothetical protein